MALNAFVSVLHKGTWIHVSPRLRLWIKVLIFLEAVRQERVLLVFFLSIGHIAEKTFSMENVLPHKVSWLTRIKRHLALFLDDTKTTCKTWKQETWLYHHLKGQLNFFACFCCLFISLLYCWIYKWILRPLFIYYLIISSGCCITYSNLSFTDEFVIGLQNSNEEIIALSGKEMICFTKEYVNFAKLAPE